MTSAVGGLLLDLATPDVGWWPLTYVSVALGLIALIGRSIGGAILVGAMYGGVFFFTHLVWVGTFLGPIPWLALAGLQTILFAVTAVPITLAFRWSAQFPRGSVLVLWAVPALVGAIWVAREGVLGAWPYGGFPWARLGVTQVDAPIASVASWTGVSGLSFVIAFLTAAGVQAARTPAGARLRRSVPPAVALSVMMLVPAFPTAPAGTLAVGWVQGNGPAGYFDDRDPGAMLNSQLQATDPLIGQRIDLLVWPEGSVDTDPTHIPETAQQLNSTVSIVGAPLLANAITTRGNETFNTSLLWTGNAADLQFYDKINPVPFGEYVPDRPFYEAIAPQLVNLIQRDYSRGTVPPVVRVNDISIGLAICFDVIYDTVIWDSVRAGADLLIFQTNNADFRGTDENLQQLAFAKMRAIETGRSVVNVSTVGTSQVIASDGRILAAAAVDTVAADITDVPLRAGTTAGVQIGPWVIPTLSALSLAGLLWLSATRTRAHKEK
ncbi:apolipoprotein N-acyltransferase [Microbacterium sp. NPDC080220]|uniref:apolipoprotein N-acyltransferase n=1 Tax=Microbacterium sp. NPDC080220 TaxID=3161017 RepID=UPI00342D5C43